jgi:hypothetical protein
MQQNLAQSQEHPLEHQRFQIVDDTLFRPVENEAVLLYLPDGSYYSLSETSIIFWEALRDGKPLESAIEQTLQKYDVERDTILQDLRLFLKDLLSYGLITVLPA